MEKMFPRTEDQRHAPGVLGCPLVQARPGAQLLLGDARPRPHRGLEAVQQEPVVIAVAVRTHSRAWVEVAAPTSRISSRRCASGVAAHPRSPAASRATTASRSGVGPGWVLVMVGPRVAVGQAGSSRISAAARRPERTAPSM